MKGGGWACEELTDEEECIDGVNAVIRWAEIVAVSAKMEPRATGSDYRELKTRMFLLGARLVRRELS